LKSRPSEETIEILRGVRSAYEEHHRLTISDEALEAAVRLSARYVTERFLPDKAIDLIDESSSRVRMYKSPAAKTSKDLMGQLREMRHNHALAWKTVATKTLRKSWSARNPWSASWSGCAPGGTGQQPGCHRR
jgi:ATP-dependent Clp protease ATP-binding subunit ClpA